MRQVNNSALDEWIQKKFCLKLGAYMRKYGVIASDADISTYLAESLQIDVCKLDSNLWIAEENSQLCGSVYDKNKSRHEAIMQCAEQIIGGKR